MKLNSPRAMKLGRALYDRYGGWDAVRAAGVERPDGIIDLAPHDTGSDGEAGSTGRDPP